MDPNAKLRRLRAWLSGDPEACPESGIRWCSMKGEPCLYNDEGNRVAWFVRTDVIAQIDRLLAEPEPAKPEPPQSTTCDHEWRSGDHIYRCDQRRGHNDHSLSVAHWTHHGPVRRCEPLAEEVARLYGFVGPDGRGRP